MTDKIGTGWPREFLEQILHEVAEDTAGPITVPVYEAWREEQSRLTPCPNAFNALGEGKWRGALRAAGLGHRTHPNTSNGERRWTEDAVRDALRTHDAPVEDLTLSDYKDLAPGDDTLPSFPIIYRHIDSWHELDDWLDESTPESNPESTTESAD